jgi:hypothetical protein
VRADLNAPPNGCLPISRGKAIIARIGGTSEDFTLGATRPYKKIILEGLTSILLKQVECNVNTGMPRTVHVIGTTNIVYINIVVVIPACWPLVPISKPVATVLKAIIPVEKAGTANAKRMVAAKFCVETGVWDATIMIAIISLAVKPVVAIVLRNVPRLLPALYLLSPLWLLLVLR